MKTFRRCRTAAVPFHVPTFRCFSTQKVRLCLGRKAAGHPEACINSSHVVLRCTGNNASGQAADGSSETTAEAAASPQAPAAQGGDEAAGEVKKPISDEEIGNAIRALREERVSAGLQDPASTSDFWKGVVEETKLIEWPSFPKVLSTTGVVVAMILGSSVVLLTVNGILSQLSDNVFKNT